MASDNSITSNSITVSPKQESGVKVLTIEAPENTGRNQRNAQFTLKGRGDYSSVRSSNSLIVTQYGKDSFVDLSCSPSISSPVSSEGITLTISGYSNYQKITFGTGTLNDCFRAGGATIAGVSGITASQLNATGGYTVKDSNNVTDPGATAEYALSFVFDIPENDGSGTVTYTGTVAGKEFTVIQATSGTSLSFSNSTVTVAADGETVVGTGVSVETSDDDLSWTATYSPV